MPQFSENIASKEDWREKQIESVLSDTNTDLKGLQDLVLKNGELSLSDDENDKNNENNINIEKKHIIGVLESVKNNQNFSGEGGIYGKNSAGIMFAVQYALSELGYEELGNIDGIYGDNTKAAVKKFQKENGLVMDGAPGHNTINKLLEKIKTTDNASNNVENSNEDNDETTEDAKTNTAETVDGNESETAEDAEKRIFNEADLVAGLKLTKRGSSGEINIYKRNSYSGIYIFDDGILKYYDGTGKQQDFDGLDENGKGIWIKKDNIDGKLSSIYTQIQKKEIEDLKQKTKKMAEQARQKQAEKLIKDVSNLKINIEENFDKGDDDNTFENIGINRENPSIKDLNKAKIWNEIFENDYDFEGTGDDEDDSRKEFVNFVGDLVGNKNINVAKIGNLKNILDEIDLPLSNLNEVLDIKLKNIVGNKEMVNNIGWIDGVDLINYVNKNNLNKSDKTIKEYLIDNIT